MYNFNFRKIILKKSVSKLAEANQTLGAKKIEKEANLILFPSTIYSNMCLILFVRQEDNVF